MVKWDKIECFFILRVNSRAQRKRWRNGVLASEGGFPGGSVVKNLPAKQETQVRSLGQEDAPREGKSNPLQYSCLQNPMDRGAWQVTVPGVTKSRTWLSSWVCTLSLSYWRQGRCLTSSKSPGPQSGALRLPSINPWTWDLSWVMVREVCLPAWVLCGGEKWLQSPQEPPLEFKEELCSTSWCGVSSHGLTAAQGHLRKH